MCILCIASRWSRHIAAMVMPMITLWAISQFLPQGFRFEINSPKLAFVGVIFVSLSWVELVTPRLSAWRTRRISAQKERKRSEEQEAAKRRKKATRRCRNCFTAYKDQTPASGRFMCTFCGHVSKRPVLDPPAGASKSSSSFSFSGSASEFLSGSVFLSVSPKDWYDRASFVRPSWGSGRNWIGVGPWIDGASWGVNASWFGGSWPGSGLYFRNTVFGWPELAGNLLGDCVFGGDRWFAGDSCSEVVCFVLRAFSQLLVSTVWVWSKLSGTEGVKEDRSNGDSKGFHSEDVRRGSSYEPKDKKARRKAEEKRLARLEKEHQEAEEKKQREEIARLVEERRRQRVKKSGKNETTETNKGKVTETQIKSEKSLEKSQDMENVSCITKENHNDLNTEKSTSKASFGAPKNTKPIRNVGVKGKEENPKAASNFFSRWSAFKSHKSVKNKPFLPSKTATDAEKKPSNLVPDLACPLKPCSAPVITSRPSPSSSNPSTKVGEHGVTSMAGTQTPWVKVLCQGTSDVPATCLEGTGVLQELCKEQNKDENESKMKADLDESDSNITVSCPATESAASTPENNRSAGEEVLRRIDTYAGQDTEITAGNIESNDYTDATTRPLVCCKDNLLVSQNSQVSLSSTSSDMSQMYNIDSFASVASQPFLNQLLPDSYVVRPTESSAMLMHETKAGLTLNTHCLPESKSLERCSSCHIWEPKAASVNESDFFVHQEEWQGSLMNRLQIATSPVDALLLQRDDLEHETHFNPEFYLPSSLLSFEESDSQQCCCGDHMPTKKSCFKSGGVKTAVCTWEELDVHYKVPPEFVDCITHSLMKDPVITADGHSYERSAIADWLRSHDTSPKTGEVLPLLPGGKLIDKTLRPNHILRSQIIEFRERLLQGDTRWACDLGCWQ